MKIDMRKLSQVYNDHPKNSRPDDGWFYIADNDYYQTLLAWLMLTGIPLDNTNKHSNCTCSLAEWFVGRHPDDTDEDGMIFYVDPDGSESFRKGVMQIYLQNWQFAVHYFKTQQEEKQHVSND